nr:MAG TPA: hypothetical protein [Caudoviricetes sp.]
MVKELFHRVKLWTTLHSISYLILSMHIKMYII